MREVSASSPALSEALASIATTLTASDASLATLAKAPNVHAEAGFVKASQDILKRELKDRYVSTLEVVLPRYEALAKKASGTRAGDIAEKDAARVRQLLRD